jgi:hypothetical protein
MFATKSLVIDLASVSRREIGAGRFAKHAPSSLAVSKQLIEKTPTSHR